MSTTQDLSNITRYGDIPNFSAAAVAAAGAFIDREFYNDDILSSAVVQRSARFDALAQAGSSLLSVPFLNPLDESIEENTANLDPNVIADIHGITGGDQGAFLNYKDQVFGSDRITSTLTGVDVMAQIAARIDRYWIQRRKKHVTTILSALAVTAGADYTIDGSGDLANYDVITDAKGLFGDAHQKARTIVMNSRQRLALRKANFGFASPQDTNTTFGQIDGMTIVETDDMPVGLMAILADECFSYGEANLGNKALRYESSERAGDGWGADWLVSRKQYILHPQGFEFIGAKTAGKASPTLDDMKNGNDWKLLAGINAKQVPFRFVKVSATKAAPAPSGS